MRSIYKIKQHLKSVIPGLVLLFTLSPMVLRAQHEVLGEKIIPLNMGDNIPESLWTAPLQTVNNPAGKEKVTLNEYRGKLILLDFWGTYCSACIAGFPKLNQIQEQNPDKVKILAISPEKREKLIQFFHSEVGKQYSYVHSVYEDTLFKQYFPHRGVPHVIWISPEGTYINPTNTYEVTQPHIDAVLHKEQSTLRIKVDLDQKTPLFLSDNFYLNDGMNFMFYSILTKGYYPGYPSGNYYRRNAAKKVYGRQMTNVSLYGIFRALGRQLFEEKKVPFNKKRMLIEATDTSLLDNSKDVDSMGYDQYYSYELIVPEDKADSLYTFMLKDLNRYLDFRLSIETRSVDCLALVRISDKDKIRSKGEKLYKTEYVESKHQYRMNNASLLTLMSLLNELPLSKRLIIDETHYTENVDIELSGLNSLSDLRKALKPYDLDIVEAKRELLMFVIANK